MRCALRVFWKRGIRSCSATVYRSGHSGWNVGISTRKHKKWKISKQVCADWHKIRPRYGAHYSRRQICGITIFSTGGVMKADYSHAWRTAERSGIEAAIIFLIDNFRDRKDNKTFAFDMWKGGRIPYVIFRPGYLAVRFPRFSRSNLSINFERHP